MSLSDCKVDENEEEKTELGIWRTNNFALGKNLKPKYFKKQSF